MELSHVGGMYMPVTHTGPPKVPGTCMVLQHGLSPHPIRAAR